MSKPAPIRYRTLNWSSYNAALRERGSLTVWFDPSTAWHAAPLGKRGTQPVYSDAAIQACLTIKVLFGLPLRQTTGFVASLLRLAGLDWPIPDFSTLCRRQKTLAVQLPYRGSGGPLHLLVDSTGIKVRGEGEWHARKHGGARRRVWRKVHLAIDEATLEVRAVEITGSGVGDAPMLPGLLDQIPESEPIASVTADGAYDGRACRDAIADRGAEAIIPPRRNDEPCCAIGPSDDGECPGRRTAPGRGPGTRPCAPSDAWAAPSGVAGAAIIDAAASKPSLSGHCHAMPCRPMDELHEAPRPKARCPRLRSPDRRTPGPHRHPQPLHRPRYPRHAARRLTSGGERGPPAFRRFVQQRQA